MHAEFFHFGAVEDFATQLEFPGQRLCLLGEIGGVAHIGRQVAEILGQRGSLGNCDALGQRFFGLRQFIAPVDAERQLAQRTADVIFLALELLEAVGRIQRDHCGLAHAPGEAALSYRDFGQEDRGIEGAGFVQCLDGGAHGGAEFLFVKFLFLAEADQQDAVAQGARDVVQKQRVARFAFHVAAPDDVGNVAIGRLVQQFGGKRELSRFENPDHDTGAALLLRATAFYAKFHRLLQFMEISVSAGLSTHFFGFVKA